MNQNKIVSIIIPCYNEEKNINRTLDGMLDLAKGHRYKFELIPVDDGSKDGTWKVIEEYSQKHSNIIGLRQMGNFGQTAAYQAGFDASTGDYVMVCAADLETPLEYINKVIDLLDEGYDLVNTNRKGRWGGEKAAKSGMANKLITAISGVTMQDRGSGMKGFTRQLIMSVRWYGEMHRFMPDYMSVYNPKMIEFDVEFKDRDFGVSYYKGHSRTVKVLLDLMALAFMLYIAKKPFKAMPGRLFGFTGAIISGVGALIALYLVILKLLGESIGDRPLFTVSILLLIVGFQSIMTGLLGELMMRNYYESTNKKTYMVRKRLN